MALKPLAVILEDRKDRAIETLSNHFSENSLPLEEYERLVEYINRTESERELLIIEKLVEEIVLLGNQDRSFGSKKPNYQASNPGGLKLYPAFLSTRHTSGSELGENPFFLAVLGTNILEIKEDELAPGVTQLEVLSILGEMRILVPPELGITMKVIPILGNTRLGRGVKSHAEPGKPELVISGCVILGEVSVKLRKEKHRLFGL